MPKELWMERSLNGIILLQDYSSVYQGSAVVLCWHKPERMLTVDEVASRRLIFPHDGISTAFEMPSLITPIALGAASSSITA